MEAQELSVFPVIRVAGGFLISWAVENQSCYLSSAVIQIASSISTVMHTFLLLFGFGSPMDILCPFAPLEWLGSHIGDFSDGCFVELLPYLNQPMRPNPAFPSHYTLQRDYWKKKTAAVSELQMPTRLMCKSFCLPHIAEGDGLFPVLVYSSLMQGMYELLHWL